MVLSSDAVTAAGSHTRVTPAARADKLPLSAKPTSTADSTLVCDAVVRIALDLSGVALGPD